MKGAGKFCVLRKERAPQIFCTGPPKPKATAVINVMLIKKMYYYNHYWLLSAIPLVYIGRQHSPKNQLRYFSFKKIRLLLYAFV